MNAEQYLKAARKETQSCQKVAANVVAPVSYVPAINYIYEKIILPGNLKPHHEWSHNMGQWFAHVRHHINNLYLGEEINTKNAFSKIVQSIEKGELPTVNGIKSITDVSGILFYFNKRHSNFSHSDLCWIFGALTRVDRLMLPDMCECVQLIHETIKKQIIDLGDKDSLYPYLSIVADLITTYFHQ